MNRTIQQITRPLLESLPKDKQYYRLDELNSFKFPSFIVRRIRIELERNLAESMIPPETDWANTDSATVQEAWDQFVEAIRAEAHLPASFAKAVIETAVEDVLNIAVQPRKNIPEIIFGANDELAFDNVCKRVRSVVIYRHFAKLLPRYMQKKQLETLTKERCRNIVVSADQRLTAQYSPLNWTQLLEPLFILQNGKVDPSLLRLFFEDKNSSGMARQFDSMNDRLSRAQFIEVLSSPDLMNAGSYEKSAEETSPDRANGHDQQFSEEPDSTPTDPMKSSTPTEDQPEEEPPEDDQELQEEDNSLNALFVEKEDSPSPEKPEPKTGAFSHDNDEPQTISTEPADEAPAESRLSRSSWGDTRGKDEAGNHDETSSRETMHRKENTATDPKADQPPEADPTQEAGADNDERLDPPKHEPEHEERLQSSQYEQEPEQQEQKSGHEEEDEEIPMWKRFFTDDTKDDTNNDVETDESYFVKESSADQSTDYKSAGAGSSAKANRPRKINPFTGELQEVEDSPSAGKKNSQQPQSSSGQQGSRQPEQEAPSTGGQQSTTRLESAGQGPGRDTQAHDTIEEGFLDEPVIDLTDSAESAEQKGQILIKRLSDKRQHYVKQIFQGSDRAYEQALEKISTFTTWREASKFIEKNIFKRNFVDIYSEQAVDFTDRLHRYFVEKQNRN